jgi:hypothetical protein
VAEAWVGGETSPPYKDCLAGPCLVAMTFHAKSRRITVYQAGKGREINANCKVYIPREYTDDRPSKNRAVFNRIVTPGIRDVTNSVTPGICDVTKNVTDGEKSG